MNVILWKLQSERAITVNNPAVSEDVTYVTFSYPQIKKGFVQTELSVFGY